MVRWGRLHKAAAVRGETGHRFPAGDGRTGLALREHRNRLAHPAAGSGHPALRVRHRWCAATPGGAGRSPPPTGATQVVRSNGPMWASAPTESPSNHPSQPARNEASAPAAARDGRESTQGPSPKGATPAATGAALSEAESAERAAGQIRSLPDDLGVQHSVQRSEVSARPRPCSRRGCVDWAGRFRAASRCARGRGASGLHNENAFFLLTAPPPFSFWGAKKKMGVDCCGSPPATMPHSGQPRRGTPGRRALRKHHRWYPATGRRGHRPLRVRCGECLVSGTPYLGHGRCGA